MGEEDHEKDTSLESFKARIASLEGKKRRKGSFRDTESKDSLEKEGESAKSGLSSGLNLAFHLGSDIAAGLVVGGVIGYVLDYCLSFRALFFIIFLLLGFAAGLVNMWRSLCRAGFSPFDSSGR